MRILVILSLVVCSCSLNKNKNSVFSDPLTMELVRCKYVKCKSSESRYRDSIRGVETTNTIQITRKF